MTENEGLSAEAIARTVAETMYRKDVASSSIGITPKEIRPGHAVMTLRITEAMLNSHGMCHGGYIFMLADSTFAYACNSYNQNTVAAAAQINFLQFPKFTLIPPPYVSLCFSYCTRCSL